MDKQIVFSCFDGILLQSEEPAAIQSKVEETHECKIGEKRSKPSNVLWLCNCVNVVFILSVCVCVCVCVYMYACIHGGKRHGMSSSIPFPS